MEVGNSTMGIVQGDDEVSQDQPSRKYVSGPSSCIGKLLALALARSIALFPLLFYSIVIVPFPSLLLVFPVTLQIV
jgi:hypothetical protein